MAICAHGLELRRASCAHAVDGDRAASTAPIEASDIDYRKPIANLFFACLGGGLRTGAARRRHRFRARQPRSCISATGAASHQMLPAAIGMIASLEADITAADRNAICGKPGRNGGLASVCGRSAAPQ